MDEACKKYPGTMHRTWGHDLDAVMLIGQLLGKDAEDDAFLHLLMDEGYVNKEDYEFLREKINKRLEKQPKLI